MKATATPSETSKKAKFPCLMQSIFAANIYLITGLGRDIGTYTETRISVGSHAAGLLGDFSEGYSSLKPYYGSVTLSSED